MTVIDAVGSHGPWLRCTLQLPMPPAQRPAEVLGTLAHAQLTTMLQQHYAPLLGIGRRQLIAVTCIAEHA